METLGLDGTDEARAPAAAERAAELLKGGAIVGLPTETVYGLAANADDADAMLRLRAIKEREPAKPFTIACATAEAAIARAAPLPVTALRLARRFWPGPLTLVVPDLSGGAVGLRVPGHLLAREVLSRGALCVALPSANTAGEPPALTADEVLQRFGGKIAAVLDGGRAAIGQPSTVVKIDRAGLEVLRTGILSEQDVRNTATQRVLFVCSGNTCRSPMAEALLKAALARKLGVKPEQLEAHGFRVHSAGLFADEGRPAAGGALRAMEKRKIELRGHRSRALTRELLDQQDRVFAMTVDLTRHLRRMAARPDRIEPLDPEGHDIPDPFGGSDAEYQECALVIERHVNRMAEEFNR